MVTGTRAVRTAAAAVAAVALSAATAAAATELPADVCRALTYFNVFALRDFHLEASEVLGPLAVGGDARLTAFSINSVGRCGADHRPPRTPALAVGGHLRADNGQINAGTVHVGRGKYTGTSLGLRCAKVVHERLDLEGLAHAATAVHDGLCATREAHCHTAVDDAGGIRMTVRGGGEVTCVVSAAHLGRASSVSIVGRRGRQIVLVKVVGRDHDDGRAVTLTNFGFAGFVPETTVVALCDVRAVVIDNVGVPAAVIAPKTDLSGPAGHILGTVIVRSSKGGVEFRHAPFGCGDAAEPSPSPEV
ncbi:hypothetical protein BU14_0457s0001 [Porphyra umbilicalis]|uniref:Choice-of-anchor A domain-containing protein n=1 Tax=Porphyra umbilicalis TaxID=2786 RepID=A0A1X6NUC6_PORUM|nr:hypothetical protein BU14_0457s0001 [Porphyra umbilicalis]|eukprot:OSX72208.1 hypothetical protein BU14_0457s0001 [Porphyra umbilicalis]